MKAIWSSKIWSAVSFFCLLVGRAPLTHAGLHEALNLNQPVKNIRIQYNRDVPQIRPDQNVNQLEAEIARILSEIRRARKIYSVQSYSIGDRHVDYCISNCACLAREFHKLLAGEGYRTRTINVHQGRDYQLRLVTSRRTWSQPYNFHQVLAVYISGHWRVIDPLMLGGAQTENVYQWVNRIERPELKIVNVF